MRSYVKRFFFAWAAVGLAIAQCCGGMWACSSCNIDPPAVVSVDPAADAVDVPFNSIITVNFSKEMDDATITPETFTISLPDGSLVDGAITFSSDLFSTYFTPTEELTDNTTYTAHVSNEITDLGGLHIEADHDWSFTTARTTERYFTIELDPDFGTDGKFDHDFALDKNDVGNGVVVQPDGKIVQSGYVNWSGVGAHDADLGILRVNTDGSLDTSFGTGGSVVLNCNSVWGEQWWGLQGLALQSDGKILVGGECESKSTIYRLNIDGSADNTFGVAGKVEIAKDIAGGDWTGDFSIAVQPDGAGSEKIIMGAIANTLPGPVQPAWLLARFNADGALDATFGDQPAHPGILIEQWDPTSNDGVRDIIILNDRSIIAYGNTYTDATYKQDFAVAKYSPDGVLDTTFGTNGLTVINMEGDDWSYSAALLDNGRIAGGLHVNCCGATSRFGVFLLTPEGVLDPTFGTNGTVVLYFDSYDVQFGNAIGALPDDRLIIGGVVTESGAGSSDFGLAMLNADGTLQTQFGTNGLVTTDFYGLGSSISKLKITDIEIDASGNVTSFKIVASGSAVAPGHATNSFALACYRSVVVNPASE